jgi:hypothetical protein
VGIYLGNGLYADVSARDAQNQPISQVKAGDVCVHVVIIDVGSIHALDINVHSKLPLGVNRVSFQNTPKDEWHRTLTNVSAGLYPAWCATNIAAGSYNTDEIMQCYSVEFRNAGRQTPWQPCAQGLPLNVGIKVL